MKRRDFLHSSLLAAASTAAGIRAAYAVVAADTAIGDVAAVSGDGRAITLRGAEIRELARQMQGTLLIAGDPDYDVARMVMNPSFDRKPALIAQPRNVADVQAAVKFARAHSVLLAVKCGGHSASGQSTCDRGMMIDLQNLRGVRVDPQQRRAWVQGGTLLGQVDGECLPHGLVTPLGTVSHTGVGGLTLGGGFGRLARKLGLAIDNLESVDIVSADGKLHHASAKDNPELFWAVRGGGGNFGIVTNFEFRLHPFDGKVIAGGISYPLARARDALTMYAEYAANAPDELYLDPALVIPPGGREGNIYLEVCYSGAPKDLEAALAPIRKLGTPASDSLRAVEYIEAQRANDTGDNRVIASYLKGGFVSRFAPELPGAIVDHMVGDPKRTTILFFQHCGGAAGRVAENATAFAQRDAVANMMAVTAWRAGEAPVAHIESTRKYWAALEPYTRGFYVNDLAREVTSAQINANFRGNYPRLVQVKKKYDPGNLFRLNANVKPA
ncbi:MAG TPA: FAD-binding oxidoreductase [Steroidobacteraceae bacterium]|nr:FAD-binding oxidoreductase [Steroidobacteraceae bacterium]